MTSLPVVARPVQDPAGEYEWPDDRAVYSVPAAGYFYSSEPDASGVYRVLGMAPRLVQAPEVEDPTGLYRLWDSSGELLYVGISNAPGIRWAQHAVDKPWWPQVAEKTVHWFVTRSEAMREESRAIKSEQPAYNKAHASSPLNESRTWTTARIDRSKGADSFARQTANILLREITTGTLRPGDRLPTAHEITVHLKVSTTVVANALRLLRQQGAIFSGSGTGSRVSPACHADPGTRERPAE